MLTFSSVPGFINVKAQLPEHSTDSAQIILVGDVGRFIGAVEPDAVELASHFSSIFKRKESPPMARPRLKKILTAVVNLSFAQSNVAVRNQGSEITIALPQTRFYTSGMSNLAADMDLPTFLSNPITMITAPSSLQINLSQVEISTTILGKVRLALRTVVK